MSISDFLALKGFGGQLNIYMCKCTTVTIYAQNKCNRYVFTNLFLYNTDELEIGPNLPPKEHRKLKEMKNKI